MPHDVSVLPGGHYKAAARILARAFQDDPAILAVLEGFAPDERIKALTAVFQADLEKCGPKGAPIEVVTGKEMAGAAIVHRPMAYPPPASAQVAILFKGFVSLWSPTAFGRWLKLLSAFDKRHPKEPHYYLEFIGVESRFRGQGLGSLMLQRLTGWADEQRVGCHLETSNPRNLPLYQRFNFQTTAEEEIIGVPVGFMWRTLALADRTA